MRLMAKNPKKPKKPTEESGAEPQGEGDRHKSPMTPFRADDPRLIAALDDYAESIRRSRNMAINLLLEEILKEKGFWPPPAGQ